MIDLPPREYDKHAQRKAERESMQKPMRILRDIEAKKERIALAKEWGVSIAEAEAMLRGQG